MNDLNSKLLPVSRISLIVCLSFIFYILGYISWYTSYEGEILYLYQEPLIEFVALFLLVITVSFFSYSNKSLKGGAVIGASLSTILWLGFMMRTIKIYEDPLLGPKNSLQVIRLYGPGSLSSISAFTAMGMFFGLLGYIYDKYFLEKPLEEAFIFRDYWSNVYGIGKNRRRELSELDQRLSFKVPWSISVHQWWDRLTQEITEKKPELIFNRIKKRQASATGEVYDVNTGRRVAEGIQDPLYLLAKYRPSLLNMPSLSHSIGSGRRLAFEEMISRFLGWFIGSSYLIYAYVALSLITSGFIIRYYRVVLGLYFTEVFTQWRTLHNWLPSLMDVLYVLGSCLIVSGLILFFVNKWRNLSSKLYEERPDERILIFSVYLCFIIGYWMSYRFITEPPYIVFGGDFSDSWLVWTKWFFLLTILLGLSYIFIHRESEVSNIYLYDVRGNLGKEEEDIYPYHSLDDEPYWVREEGQLYWVMRYMYYWPMELTLVPHPDWERIEVWVDAYTGELRWVVSDYHYRELWYKVEDDNDRLTAGFLINFHTPIPLVKPEDVSAVNQKLNQPTGKLMKMMLTGSSDESFSYSMGDSYWNRIHPPEWIKDFGLVGPTARFCGNLKWSYWRYPWGVDDIERYRRQPASKREEQPKHDVID